MHPITTFWPVLPACREDDGNSISGTRLGFEIVCGHKEPVGKATTRSDAQMAFRWL
jgi:hypothetical protein